MSSLYRAMLSVTAVTVCLLAIRASVSIASPDASAVRVGFGAAVVVGDGEIFVGEGANNFRPGTVYIYRKTGGRWQEASTLRAPESAVLDQFGTSLALDGTSLFVGAGSGLVHVFRKQGTAWTSAGTVATSLVPGGTAQFGTALAASGEWLLVGRVVAGAGRGGRGGGGGGGGGRAGAAPAAELPAGAVYVFRQAAGGQFVYHTTLSSPDAGSAGDMFGSSIGVSGSTALIGAAGQAERAGVVHEFNVNASGAWTRERSFAPVGLAAGDGFGSSVAMTGDRAVVAASGDGGGHGAVYVLRKGTQAGGGFGGGGGGGGGGGAAPPTVQWLELARITAPVGTGGDGFATALAASEDEVWVGAPTLGGVGGAYVFPVGADGFEPGVVRFLTPGAGSAGAGRALSVRGAVAAVGVTQNSATSRESVIIFERDGTGTWRAEPAIFAAMDELAPVTGEDVRCAPDGKAGQFDCGNVQLNAFLPPSSLTSDGHYIQMNDIWGWTDPVTGKEWAILGRRDGTTFVDISNPNGPLPVADLPLTDGARPAAWRDMKVYKDHAYIVSDGAGQHGMQIFDLARLRTLAPVNGQPVLIRQDATYTEIASAHNIVINEDSGYAYAVGSSGGGTTCAGGLHAIDLREPMNPRFAGCFFHTGTGRGGGGYTHDAQCVNYHGPDQRYAGKEICIGANETAISIADVTDKANPIAISQASYPSVAYAHQGWFTEDHRYWFLNDEIDENQGIERTRTLIWDLADLQNPRLAKEHMGVETSTDHNLYIKDDLMYQANYKSGLRILNVSDPENPREVGYFDTAPFIGTTPGYNGAWSVYPFFPSGAIVVSSIEQGLFIVRYTPQGLVP